MATDEERRMQGKACALGMWLALAIFGLGFSYFRVDRVAATAITDDGMMIGYHSAREACLDGMRTLAMRAGAVGVRTPWGEEFNVIALTCDGSDPRKRAGMN